VERRIKPGEEEQQLADKAAKYGLKNMLDSLLKPRLLFGENQYAVDYAGRVYLFAGEVQMRKFCTDPKLFLAKPPRIDSNSLALGFALLSPCGFRTCELANCMNKTYGFDVVNLTTIVENALHQKAKDYVEPTPELAEGEEEVAPIVVAPAQLEDTRLRLLEEEKKALMTGQALGKATFIRLFAEALGVEKNLDLARQRNETIEAQTKQLEQASEAGTGIPAGIIVDEDDPSKPLVDYTEPVAVPSRGFVLINFPESPDFFNDLRSAALIDIEKVIMLEYGAAPATELERTIASEKETPGSGEPITDVLTTVPKEILEQEGCASHKDDPFVDAMLQRFAALADGGLPVVKVPLQADEQSQFIQIQKLIDPFYVVVEDPSVGIEIPDPDGWEAPPPEDPEDGKEPLEPLERPVIPWGVTGPYCPVTFKDEFWLFPGQKEAPGGGASLQHVIGNSVYSFANEVARDAFLAEPRKYLREEEPVVPPPRILITGPTGSGASKQCELLSEVYRLPVLNLEDAWLKSVGVRVESFKAAKKKKEVLAALDEQPMIEDGAAAFPSDWKPAPPKVEDEDAAAEDEGPAPEDDGFGDDADGRENLYVEAMRDVLSASCGSCVVNGSFFGDPDRPGVLAMVHATPEVWEEMKERRSLQNLLMKARRIPDTVLILKCKHDTAARATYDFAQIDADFEAKVNEFKVVLSKFDEESGEDPPKPENYGLPEGFNPEDEQEETESKRVKDKFVEKKTAEEEGLKEFLAAMKAARTPITKIPADRGHDATHKGIRWCCRTFLENRASLILRSQANKVTPQRQIDKLTRTLALQSRFADSNTMAVDAPLFAGRPDAFRNCVELRRRLYYPRSEADRDVLLERPQDYVRLTTPSSVSVHPAVVVSGPPLAGKTTLAKELAKRTGAVYLSVPELVGKLCGPDSTPCDLSREIVCQLKKGERIQDETVIAALRHRLGAPDVLTRGWVLDDFPVTAQQVALLNQAGVVPHRIFLMRLEERLIFARCEAAGASKGDNLVQQEPALQRKRVAAYAERAPGLVASYALMYDNVCDIDGSKSQWAIYDQALKETSLAVTQRLEYYRRTSKGEATPIRGMCFPPERIEGNESDWNKYCPLSLTTSNELVRCYDPRCCVEYKTKIYWTSSEENARTFASDPEAFLQVPLPQSTPTPVPYDARIMVTCQLEGYCPVTLVDEKNLVKTNGQAMMRFQGKLWSVQGKAAAAKFMRRPMRYVQRAKLPNKKPPPPLHEVNDSKVQLLKSLQACDHSKGLEPAEMLTYMQACVAEQVCQALVESGERRPLCPGKSPQESALLFLAKFLRSRNPLNTPLRAAEMKAKFADFLSDCELPNDLKQFTARKLASGEADEWTGSDARRYAELCERFDGIFPQPT
jgi:adenylate kinase family enzyme/YHS domain-containing protein